MNITHLVFDLGGVIVELRGLPIRHEWTDGTGTADAVWQKWLTSEAPRAFESGQISADEFARRIVSELSLNVSAGDYLEYFSQLPVGPYTGALDMLHQLKQGYTTALFSNSNAIHWERKMGEMQLGDAFHHHFASHLMGRVKPDPEAFAHIVSGLGVQPGHILFFDDNQLNVDAARAAGMHSEQVKGLDALQASLSGYGIQW